MARTDAGFTLVELLIAIAILSSIAAGVAGLFGVAIKTTEGARVQTATVALAIQKMEQLRALTWGFDAAGVGRVTDSTTDLSVEPSTGSGSGLSPSPPGTLDSNIAGFVDYLDKNGRWVGTGASPPGQAVFIRRWSVDALAGAPDDTLLLQVLVTTVIREATGWAGGGVRPRLRDDALFVTFKTRKAR